MSNKYSLYGKYLNGDIYSGLEFIHATMDEGNYEEAFTVLKDIEPDLLNKEPDRDFLVQYYLDYGECADETSQEKQAIEAFECAYELGYNDAVKYLVEKYDPDYSSIDFLPKLEKAVIVDDHPEFAASAAKAFRDGKRRGYPEYLKARLILKAALKSTAISSEDYEECLCLLEEINNEENISSPDERDEITENHLTGEETGSILGYKKILNGNTIALCVLALVLIISGVILSAKVYNDSNAGQYLKAGGVESLQQGEIAYYVSSDSAKLFSEANADSDVAGQLKKYDELFGETINLNYIQGKTINGEKGWVDKSSLKAITAPNKEDYNNPVSYVNNHKSSEGIAVHPKPEKGTVLFRIPEGEEFSVYYEDEDTGYLFIEHKSGVGWYNRDYAEKGTAEDYEPYVEGGTYVLKKTMNVRSGPGRNYETVGDPWEKGESVYVYEVKESDNEIWLKVGDYDGPEWICGKMGNTYYVGD